MNIVPTAKRIFLFLMVNILVMITVTLVLALLRVGNYFPAGGLAGLAVFSLVWGFAGALISLALSRLMAKWFMGVRVVPVDPPTLLSRTWSKPSTNLRDRQVFRSFLKWGFTNPMK